MNSSEGVTALDRVEAAALAPIELWSDQKLLRALVSQQFQVSGPVLADEVLPDERVGFFVPIDVDDRGQDLPGALVITDTRLIVHYSTPTKEEVWCAELAAVVFEQSKFRKGILAGWRSVFHITAPANLTVVCVDLNKDGPLGYIVGGLLSGTITMRWTAEGRPEGLTMEA